MRKLIDATNVDGASGDYPKGRVRDEALPTLGTILNEILVGDIQQFFQKLVIDAGITENNLPDNVSNGYQLIEALVSKINSVNGGLITKLIDIGDWNMDTASQKIVAHGLDITKIRDVSLLLRNDTGALFPIGKMSDTGTPVGFSTEAGISETFSLDATHITLARTTGGVYDNAGFDSTSYNRGWITIKYVE